MAMEDAILPTQARTILRANDQEAIEEGLEILYAERVNLDKAREVKALERSLNEKLNGD